MSVRGCADRSGRAVVLSAACSSLVVRRLRLGKSASRPGRPSQAPPEKLSQYGLFVGNGVSQEPAEGVIPYDLNSALFSDYALKYRFSSSRRGRMRPTATATPLTFPSAP